MKVLCITSSYPRSPQDISGDFVARWRRELAARGARVTILTWRSPEDAASAEPDVHRVPYALRAHREQLFYGAGAPENIAAQASLLALAPAACAAMFWCALTLGRQQDFDCVVGHWLIPGGFLAHAVGRCLGIPSAVITHSGGIDMVAKLPAPVARALVSGFASYPMTFVSQEARARFCGARSGALHRTSRILPMGFDAAAGPPERGLRWPRSVLCMGRQVEIKGWARALDALARVSGVHVHFAGAGPERARLEARARQLGVRATFHGVVTGEQKADLLSRCEVALFASGCMPGRREGLPVSFLECAHAGALPLVAHLPATWPLLGDATLQRLDASRAAGIWAHQLDAIFSLEDATFRAVADATARNVAPLRWEALGEAWWAWLREVKNASGGAL